MFSRDQLPQELDFQQGVQILLPVVPVAVGGPGGMDEPQALIVAHIGTGQAGGFLNFSDGHRDAPFPIWSFLRPV